MSNNRYIAQSLPKTSKLDDYLMLTKFRLSLFVVISSALAYIAAVGSNIDFVILTLLCLGGFLCTGASNALNQVLERDFDKLMTRTENRPLAAGRMKTSEAVLFSGLSLLIGTAMLSWISPLASLLCMLSVVIYSFVYTPLKRYTTLSVAIGAIPGSLPVLIGAVAGSGTITILGIGLFAIQFFWQFPHFWAIGWLSFKDYKKAGYKLLPITEGGDIHPKLGLHAFVYALILIPVSVLPLLFMEMHIALSVLILLCGVAYALAAFRFYLHQNRPAALKLMFTSFFYLPIVLLLYIFV